MEIFTLIIEQLQAFQLVEWVATITAIIYVILAARNNDWCWAFGVISSAAWALASYSLYGLYLDAILQLFYVIMGIAGIYKWQYQSDSSPTDTSISSMTKQEHIFTFAIGIPLALLFGYFFATYSEAASTYLDALTTVFAIITTFWLVQKRIENWLYWIVIDFAYVYLYGSRGAWLFAALMIINIIVAIQGWFKWKKELNGY